MPGNETTSCRLIEQDAFRFTGFPPDEWRSGRPGDRSQHEPLIPIEHDCVKIEQRRAGRNIGGRFGSRLFSPGRHDGSAS